MSDRTTLRIFFVALLLALWLSGGPFWAEAQDRSIGVASSGPSVAKHHAGQDFRDCPDVCPCILRVARTLD
ncbi:MAG: hypothetical protein OXI53_05725 [Nitrospira sp.]|nr:hypothetical protein [Nitrospira sp.]